MEFKGTKGKWEINNESSNGIIDVSNAHNIQSNYNYLDICAVWKDVETDNESLANAQLIASAPEMFEMLKELLIDIDEFTIPTSMNDTIFRAKQLLTKITTL